MADHGRAIRAATRFSVTPLCIFLRLASQQLSQHQLSSLRLQDVEIPCLTTNPVSLPNSS